MLDLTAFSKTLSFDPETTKGMGLAFDKARQQLGLSEKVDPVTQVLAERIIDLASAGERDAKRLQEHALSFFIN